MRGKERERLLLDPVAPAIRRTLGRLTMRVAAMCLLVSVVSVASAGSARAQTLDLYQGTVVGSPRIVGMGGAVAAAAEDMTGTLSTPAAMAFRPPGSPDWWDWDFYVDALVATRDTDLTNSGLPSGTDRAVEAYAGGIGFYLGKWGVGISGSGVSYGLPAATPGAAPTELNADTSQLALARSLLDGQLGLGVSLAIAEFSIDQGTTGLFSLTSVAIASGVLWRPRAMPWRAGISGRFPPMAGEVTNSCVDPTDCNGVVPPTGGEAPWQLGAGFAWRFGQADWNQPNPVLFRDERAVVVAADVGVVGRLPDGTSVAGFAAQIPQASGRSLNLSARLGAEWEIVPGRLRARAGTYWEPERITGRGGRLHGTAGLEVRLFRFSFWDKERRVRLAIASDVAERYQNITLSVGLWH